jgi:hypothetical protein
VQGGPWGGEGKRKAMSGRQHSFSPEKKIFPNLVGNRKTTFIVVSELVQKKQYWGFKGAKKWRK